jgi:glycosyl hydrolase family 25
LVLYGVDVSHWQQRTPSLAGASFLIARATIGTMVDETYDMHIANARRAGLLVGAYHFNWDGISIAAQVSAFVAAAGAVDFYALDVEGLHAFSRAQATEFIQRFHDLTRKRIFMYHSDSGFMYAGQDHNWVANWSVKPSRDFDLWQYGTFNGVDGNKFYGTLAQLKALSNLSTSLPDTSTEAPVTVPIKTLGLFDVHVPSGTQLYDVDYKPTVAISSTQERTGFINTGTGWLLIDITSGGVYQLALVKTSAVTFSPRGYLDAWTPEEQKKLDDAVAAQVVSLTAAQVESAKAEGAEAEQARIRALLGL